MKIALVLAAAAFALAGCSSASPDAGDVGSSPDNDITKTDACAKSALSAAEDEYGNDPMRTKIKVLTPAKKYAVTVGIGNPEDGAHDYYVEFSGSCSSKPTVTEVPSYPHPLRDAMHTTYDALLGKNKNTFPSANAVKAGDLPKDAKKQYLTWSTDGKSVCTSVDAYKIEVSGKDTFAVACTADNSGSVKSYDFSFAVWDADGGDIDQASVWENDKSVGTNGISWQNETFEEKF